MDFDAIKDAIVLALACSLVFIWRDQVLLADLGLSDLLGRDLAAELGDAKRRLDDISVLIRVFAWLLA